MGSLPGFARDPIGFLTDATRKYGDLLFLGKVFGKGLYVLSRPEHLEHVLLTNNQNYVKGKGLEPLKLVVGEGLVVAEGDRWHRQRRLIQPTFHRQHVAALVDRMAEVIEGAHHRWAARPATEPIEVFPEMMRLTQLVLLTTMFGVDIESRADELCKAWNVAVEFLTERLLGPPIHIPVSIPTPKNLRFRRAMKTLDDAVYGILRDRRAGDGGHRDFTTLLLAARDAATGEAMTDEELRDEIITVFSGGFETSAVALSWVWHVIATHPEVERKLHAEVDEVLGDRRLTSEDLPKLRYTRMIIDETLRLYPAAWIFARTNVGPDRLGEYPLPAGSLLFICPYLAHRHPEHWEDPERFDPERMRPDRRAAQRRGSYIPFGNGPRLCVGEAFAMSEMQAVLAMTARRYRLRSVPGHDAKMRGMFTLRASPPVVLRVEERPQAERVSVTSV